MAKFMGRPMSDSLCEAIVNETSFDKMKEQDEHKRMPTIREQEHLTEEQKQVTYSGKKKASIYRKGKLR